MKAKIFKERGTEKWDELEQVLNRFDENCATEEDARRLPSLFRRVCSDLSLAQARMYRLSLCERLNELVIRSYSHLHHNVLGLWGQFLIGVKHTFPRLVREEWKLLWLVNAFFWIPYIGIVVASYIDMRWVESLLGAEEMAQLQAGYGKDGGFDSIRDNFGSNFGMFFFYIRNNVGIDFQVFAGGIFAGIGTLFFVLFNALKIGAATGYVIQEADGSKVSRLGFRSQLSGVSRLVVFRYGRIKTGVCTDQSREEESQRSACSCRKASFGTFVWGCDFNFYRCYY